MSAGFTVPSEAAPPGAAPAGEGLLLVAANRQICRRNAAAARLLDCADALADRAGRLIAVRPADDARLGRAIEALLHDGARPGRPVAMGLPRRSGLADYVLLLTIQGDRPPAHLLVAIHDFAALPTPSAALLQQCFGLTPVQATVASLVAAGAAPTQVAQRLGVSLSTVRTHLRGVFRRTSCTGQVDLARRLTALAMAMVRQEGLDHSHALSDRFVQLDESGELTIGRRGSCDACAAAGGIALSRNECADVAP